MERPFINHASRLHANGKSTMYLQSSCIISKHNYKTVLKYFSDIIKTGCNKCVPVWPRFSMDAMSENIHAYKQIPNISLWFSLNSHTNVISFSYLVLYYLDKAYPAHI